MARIASATFRRTDYFSDSSAYYKINKSPYVDSVSTYINGSLVRFLNYTMNSSCPLEPH